MKKIYSFVFAAVALFTAASCQKELVNVETTGGDFTVTAIASADTKTALSGDKAVVWTPGDKISVFDANGEAIAFGTDITEKTATAKFTNTAEFAAPGSLVAVYPHRGGNEDGSYQKLSNNIITNFRVGTPQTAVAGSFDSSMAGAIGLPKEEGSNELVFKSIHSLVKFTIGGDTAPTSVKLINNSGTMIAGLYNYDLENNSVINEGAAAEITLTGSFEVGKTYYIAVIPYDVKTTLTLEFDGVAAKTSKEITLEPNKIYNLGTIEKAAPPVVTATKVWDAAVPFGGGQTRNMTMDGEYVYVAQSAGGNGVIKAISIADPTVTKDVKVTTYTPAGLDNGTHAISCVRMLPNSDASINNGKPVLVASNLTIGDGTEKLIVYVWTNGIDADPNYFVIDSGLRRVGDKFTFKGTYQSGELYFFDYNDGNTAIRVNMANGVAGLWGAPELAYATGRYVMPVEGAENIGECTIHPNATFDEGNPTSALLVTNKVNGFFTQNVYTTNTNDGVKTVKNEYVASAWGTDPALTQTWGYNFFTHNEKNCIAYVKVANGRTSAVLNIIEDINGAADFKGTLEAKSGLFSAPVNGTGNAGYGVGDCAVHQTADGVTYVAVMAQNIGITLYKLD